MIYLRRQDVINVLDQQMKKVLASEKLTENARTERKFIIKIIRKAVMTIKPAQSLYCNECGQRIEK